MCVACLCLSLFLSCVVLLVRPLWFFLGWTSLDWESNPSTPKQQMSVSERNIAVSSLCYYHDYFVINLFVIICLLILLQTQSMLSVSFSLISFICGFIWVWQVNIFPGLFISKGFVFINYFVNTTLSLLCRPFFSQSNIKSYQWTNNDADSATCCSQVRSNSIQNIFDVMVRDNVKKLLS